MGSKNGDIDFLLDLGRRWKGLVYKPNPGEQEMFIFAAKQEKVRSNILWFKPDDSPSERRLVAIQRCTPCITRHKGCDRNFPACSSCEKGGQDCERDLDQPEYFKVESGADNRLIVKLETKPKKSRLKSQKEKGQLGTEEARDATAFGYEPGETSSRAAKGECFTGSQVSVQTLCRKTTR